MGTPEGLNLDRSRLINGENGQPIFYLVSGFFPVISTSETNDVFPSLVSKKEDEVTTKDPGSCHAMCSDISGCGGKNH